MSACMPPTALVDLAQGRLEGAARQAAEIHETACPACEAELRRLRRLLEAVREVPVAQPSGDFLSRVRKEVAFIRRAEEEAEEAWVLLKARPWWQRPWIPTAAAAALMAAISAGLWMTRVESPSPSLPPGAFPKVAQDPKAGRSPVLPKPFPFVPGVPERVPEPPSLAHVPSEPLEPPSLPLADAGRPEPVRPEPDFRYVEEPDRTSWTETPVVLPGVSPSRMPSAIVAEPSPAESGCVWLLDRQNADGGWGEVAVEQNLASAIQVSSLAVLALTEDPRPGSDPCLDLALDFLKGHQDPAGLLGPSCDKRTLVQAMGTAALAGLARTRPEAREPLRKAALALLKSRGADGWSKDGAPGQSHAVATAWASAALLRAQSAGAGLPKDWMQRVSRGCQRLVARCRKTAGLFRQGDEAQTGGGWASTVAVGATLSWLGETAEARLLVPAALSGAKTCWGLSSMEEADPEILALLALWARSDATVLPEAAREGLRDAFQRWKWKGGKDAAHWTTRSGSRWDSLAGEAYATALAVWTLELAEPPAKPSRRP